MSQLVEADDGDDELTPDDIFHILQTERRRDAMRYVMRHDEPVKMSDLTEYVAAKENGIESGRVSSKQRQRVYIPLYQAHLPKLDEEGIIEYNQPRGIIKPADRLDVFRPYLELEDCYNGGASDGPTHDYPLKPTNMVAVVISILVGFMIGVYAATGIVTSNIYTVEAVSMIAMMGLALGMIGSVLFVIVSGLNRHGINLSQKA